MPTGIFADILSIAVIVFLVCELSNSPCLEPTSVVCSPDNALDNVAIACEAPGPLGFWTTDTIYPGGIPGVGWISIDINCWSLILLWHSYI